MSPSRTSKTFAIRTRLWRYTLLTHRWVGIAVGIVVLVWCLSGFVMMYVRYPALEPIEQLTALTPLENSRCCDETLIDRATDSAAGTYLLENLLGRTVLRFPTVRGGPSVFDTDAGRWVDLWTEEELNSVGSDYAQRQGWQAPHTVTPIVRDQWTVAARFNPHRPMLKFENARGANWYVSSSTAQIVQVTTRSERFWNWLGSVPHWLYPTVLRQHGALWAQVVIWMTLISLFLVVTGIVVGIKQFRFKSPNRRSPYRAWMLWHHYAGLVFGLFTLTWVLSGLFSMNPWGLLESRSFAEERRILNGVEQPLVDVLDVVDAVLPSIPADTVRLESAYWLGEPFFLAWNAAGVATRLAADGARQPVSETDISRAVDALGLKDTTVDRLADEDAYYYSLHEDVPLPAWRIQDPSGDRLYISEATGRVQYALDTSGASNRWLFQGLHSLDFTALFRARPVWDILLLLLLAGVTVGVGTGTWLGIRRLTR